MDDPEPELFPVTIGSYLDPAWATADTKTTDLDSIASETDEIARVLAAFGVRLVPWDGVPPDARTLEPVTERLVRWSDRGASHDSVLYWAGHGYADGNGNVALAIRDTLVDRALATGLSPEKLAEFVAERGSESDRRPWSFIIVDACRSSQFVERLGGHIQLHYTGTRGVLLFGVSGGAARIGEFRRALERCLDHTYHTDAAISLADLSNQLQRELFDSYATSLGLVDARLSRSVPGAPPGTPLDVVREVEELLAALTPDERRHFVPKGQGGEAGETVWYFEGRLAEQREIADWLRREDRGLLVVTGAPGSGKSALLGHVLVQSRPLLRTILVRHNLIAALPEDDRPSDDVFAAALLLTGMSPVDVVRAVGAAAGLVDPPAVENLIWLTPWLENGLRQRATPLTLLLDALDEAEQPTAVAELLRLLVATGQVRIVLGTRPSLTEGPDLLDPDGDQSLLHALGPADRQVVVPRDAEAVYRYVRRRLNQLHVTESVAHDIAVVDHEFLFARLVVHEVLARPDLLTSARAELNRLLSGTHRAVFAAAVARLAAAAPVNYPLLHALGYARGRGMPIRDGIWAAAAATLATGVTVDADAVHELLDQAAPYVLLDSEDNQTVYRLAHRTFAEHFTADQTPEVVAANNERILDALLELKPPANRNPYLDRHAYAPVRIAVVYATGYRYIDKDRSKLRREFRLGQVRQPDALDLGDGDREQLPNWLPAGEVAPTELAFDQPVPGAAVRAVDMRLYVLRSDQVIAAVILNLDTLPLTVQDDRGLPERDSVRPTSAVLAQCVRARLRVKGRPLADYIHHLVEGIPEITAGPGTGLLPERHQLVFVRRLHPAERVPDQHTVDEILRRGNDDPLYDAGMVLPRLPDELNQRGTLGVVTPQVSILYGHEAFIEDSILLSAVYATGTAARFREIWQNAHQQARHFNTYLRRRSGQQSRADYEELVDNLGNLEFDLTVSVELPVWQVETFTVALFDMLNLAEQATALSELFVQLGASLSLSHVAIEIREKRDADRDRWRTVAVGVVAVVMVPTGLVLELLATNTSQVVGLSMWDGRYGPLYLGAFAAALIPAAFTLSALGRTFPALRRLGSWLRRPVHRRGQEHAGRRK